MLYAQRFLLLTPEFWLLYLLPWALRLVPDAKMAIPR